MDQGEQLFGENRLWLSGAAPWLATERRPQIVQSYFSFLPFALADIVCLALAEILAEKIRACYQRNKARDIYDLGVFATRPLDHAVIRRLVVLKLWQARDAFDPARLLRKFEDGRDFDWDDLRQLLNRAVVIDREKITTDCVRGFGYLMLTPEQQAEFVRDLPEVFLPIHGGWGRMGMTHIRLAKASEDVLVGALRSAWMLRREKNARTKKKTRAPKGRRKFV
ncbi:MAG TPA: nucleotidyl transferase AbiEii/AbiGii toxin family protein [Terriglobales bacterium]|nr:nucleotidyl transferase AbiEii/AbiGii toxin family protein [Terriglobales bacterium]